jgi:hypothetical protein
MAVVIDRLTTEVTAEPERQLAGAGAAPAPTRLSELARIRFLIAAAARLDRRTCAEGYDD